jgi:hypothetical protein
MPGPQAWRAGWAPASGGLTLSRRLIGRGWLYFRLNINPLMGSVCGRAWRDRRCRLRTEAEPCNVLRTRTRTSAALRHSSSATRELASPALPRRQIFRREQHRGCLRRPRSTQCRRCTPDNPCEPASVSGCAARPAQQNGAGARGPCRCSDARTYSLKRAHLAMALPGRSRERPGGAPHCPSHRARMASHPAPAGAGSSGGPRPAPEAGPGAEREGAGRLRPLFPGHHQDTRAPGSAHASPLPTPPPRPAAVGGRAMSPRSAGQACHTRRTATSDWRAVAARPLGPALHRRSPSQTTPPTPPPHPPRARSWWRSC